MPCGHLCSDMTWYHVTRTFSERYTWSRDMFIDVPFQLPGSIQTLRLLQRWGSTRITIYVLSGNLLVYSEVKHITVKGLAEGTTWIEITIFIPPYLHQAEIEPARHASFIANGKLCLFIAPPSLHNGRPMWLLLVGLNFLFWKYIHIVHIHFLACRYIGGSYDFFQDAEWEWVNIALCRFLHIDALSRQDEARIGDQILLLSDADTAQ